MIPHSVAPVPSFDTKITAKCEITGPILLGQINIGQISA